MTIIDLAKLYSETAKLSDLSFYLENSLEQAGEGNEVILTGKAPLCGFI